MAAFDVFRVAAFVAGLPRRLVRQKIRDVAKGREQDMHALPSQDREQPRKDGPQAKLFCALNEVVLPVVFHFSSHFGLNSGLYVEPRHQGEEKIAPPFKF